MLLLEYLQADSDTHAYASSDVRLRVHGGARNLETIPLVAGNHAIGSGPKCSVRLRDAGVGPMHGLITLDDRGARVRRWAGGTYLNGRPFVEETLSAGDRLSVGPIDLEIIGTGGSAESWDAPSTGGDEVASEPIYDQPAAAVHATPVEATVEKSLDDFQASVETLDAIDELPAVVQVRPAKRSTGRKLRSALRRQRVEFTQLLARVETLADRVEAAIAERHEVEDAAGWRSATAEWSAAADAEAAAWEQERSAYAEQIAALQAELAVALRQLMNAQAELGVAQESIDDLQKRLAESEEMWRELSDERADWQRQLADLEIQLAEVCSETRRLQDEPADRKSAAAKERREPAAVADWPRSETAEDNSAAEDRDEVAGAYDWAALSVTGSVECLSEAPEPENDSRSKGAWGFESDAEVSESDAIWTTREEPVVDESAVFPFDRVGRHDEIASGAAGIADSGLVESVDARPDRVRDALKLFADSTDEVPEAEMGSASRSTNDDVETPSDVEQALAHLQELSLWRQTPETSELDESKNDRADTPIAVANEESIDSVGDVGSATSLAAEPESFAMSQPAAAEDGPTAIEGTSAPKSNAESAAQDTTAPASTSFIDPYAHLFEQDAPAEQPPAPAPVVSQKEEPKPVRAAEPVMPSGAPAIDADSTASDAEDSIEHYMARMMQRIRGDAAASGSSSGSQAVASGAASNSAANKRTSTSVAPSAPVETASEQPLIRLEDLKSKVPTPEFGTDMNALRALANQSARHAIGVHTARTLRRKAMTRFIVSLLAGVTSLYFMLNAPDWQSREFSTACVALIASIYWGQLTLVLLLKAVRVGAFDEIATDFKSVDKLEPPLPIDVARR